MKGVLVELGIDLAQTRTFLATSIPTLDLMFPTKLPTLLE